MDFTDFISVSGASESGLSLLDLDITIDDLNDIVSSEFASGTALAQAKINLAYKKVAADVILKSQSSQRASSLLSNQRIGYGHEDRSLVTPDGKLKGIYVGFEPTEAFTKFTINTLRIHLDTTGDVDVEIWDIQNGELLDTITVSAVANTEVSISVNKTYSSKRGDFKLALLYDPNGAKAVQTTVKPNGCLSCSIISKHRNAFLESKAVTIATGTTKTYNNLKATQETGGLSIDYSLDCDYFGWVASNRQTMALALLNKAGAEIARYAFKVSTRTNSTTNIDSEKWNMLLEEYETNYDKYMTSFYSGMRIPDNPCFCRTKQIAVKTML